MRYQEFVPNGLLRPYVQCFFTCETDSVVVNEDTVFATGAVEIMFNLGTDEPQKIINGGFVNQPGIQLWGQTIRPFTFTSLGKHAMFGVRFFTHTAACFFNDPIAMFNDQMLDFADVAGKSATLLRSQLIEAESLQQKIDLVENFLLAKLVLNKRKLDKLALVSNIMQELTDENFFENINSVANRYGVSSRYLQTIFLNYAGLSPKLSAKIVRFQKSLQLITKNESPLTTIAYKCGYYDQSHFIKDFKYFTGFSPSKFHADSSTDLSASLGN